MQNNPKPSVDVQLPDLEQARMRAVAGALALIALGNRGEVTGVSPVTPQVAPATLTDIAAVVTTRKASGTFLVLASVDLTGVNTDTYQLALRHYVQVATMLPVGNSTQPGSPNAYVALASGPLTYAGAPAPQTDTTTGQIEVITGELTQHEMLFCVSTPAALAVGENVAFALSVSASSGNIIFPAGCLNFFVIELP